MTNRILKKEGEVGRGLWFCRRLFSISRKLGSHDEAGLKNTNKIQMKYNLTCNSARYNGTRADSTCFRRVPVIFTQNSHDKSLDRRAESKGSPGKFREYPCGSHLYGQKGEGHQPDRIKAVIFSSRFAAAPGPCCSGQSIALAGPVSPEGPRGGQSG